MINKECFPTLSINQSCCLDLMRFFAVQLVIIGHILSFMEINFFHLGEKIPIQNLGVVVFFILSGYLISYSLYSNLIYNKNYTFKDFFKDRFFRIYVTLIPCLIFIATLDSLIPDYQYSDAFNIKNFAGNLLMLQDFPIPYARFSEWSGIKNLSAHLQISSFGSARPLWTLSVEWWFYMAFGWFFLKLINQRPIIQPVKLAGLGIFLLLLIVPLYNLRGRGNGLTWTWLLGSFVFFGVYYQKIKLELSFSYSWFVISNLLFFCVMMLLSFYLATFYDPRISILVMVWFTMNLAFSNQIKLPISGLIRKKFIGIIRIAGGYSYSLYLVHYTIIQWFVNVYGIDEHKYTVALMAFSFSNIVAVILYFLFDKNYKKIKNARFYAPISSIK